MASQMQYYDGKFITEEWNLVYQNLINCVPVKPPYFNNSFRTLFTQGGGEKWDKKQFFVNKRKWFKKIKMYECPSEHGNELVESNDTWNVTDMIEYEWFRYFLVINDDKTQLRIYKQTNIPDISQCSNSCFNDIEEWHIVNITNYKGNNYFPFAPCLFDRFVEITHGKWKTKDSGTEGVARSWRVDNSVFSCLYNDDGTPIAADAWDYIYITSGWPISGYLVQVAGRLADVDPSNGTVPDNALMVTPPGTWLPWLSLTGPSGSTANDAQISDIHYTIFPKYGLTFHFVTADGIVHWGYDQDECSTSEYTINIDTSNKKISSFSVFDDSIAYMDQNTWILAIWWQWFMKFNFNPSLWIITHGLYTNIIEYMWYLVLAWPDNMWYFSYNRSTGASLIKSITNTNWYFTSWSFGSQDGNFFLIRKSKNFYQMWITTSAYTLPIWYFTFMNNFLNTDLGMLDRRSDECNLELFDDKFWIVMNDGSADSKILIHDQYYQLRYKWYITWCAITRVVEWVFLGKGIFKYDGITDNGNDITQIITMTWWDEWHTATKKIEYVKIPFGYNSYMQETSAANQTGNCTFFSASADDSWRWYNSVYGQLSRTDYVDNLMKLKFWPEIDNDTTGLIKHFPIWIDINGRLWVNQDKTTSTLAEEFNQYHHFYDDYPNTDESDDPSVYYVAKMWVIKVPLASRWEVFTFELVARWNNNIEFGWFFIGFQYPDIDINRYENNLTLNDEWLTPDSGYSRTPINTGPDEILGVTP